MKQPKISIIVPVFNAEVYLKRCINSIISQTFTDWELLLVDDGSSDKSGRICDEYAETDRRISSFHKTNGGVSTAREIGMLNAKGVYSIHVDPDDWININSLELLYGEAISKGADIVIGDFVLEYGSHTEILCQQVDTAEELLKKLFLQERHGSLCNKLIRTELFYLYDLHFPSEMICWEDLFVCCSLLMSYPCKLVYLPYAFYHYDFSTNPNSMVRKATKKTLDSMIYFCRYFENCLPNNSQFWLNETKGIVLVTAYRCNLLSAEDIRLLFPEINKWYINKYLHDYKHVMYCGLAQVLNGKSMKSAHRFQRYNSLLQRIVNRINRYL